MTKTLAGTVALVTGASSGNGAATALGRPPRCGDWTLARTAPTDSPGPQGRHRLAGGTGAGPPRPCHPSPIRWPPPWRTRSAELGSPRHIGQQRRLVAYGQCRRRATARTGMTSFPSTSRGALYATRTALPHLIAAAADSPRGVADIVTISSTGGRVARPGTACVLADQVRRQRVQRRASVRN